MSQIRKRAIVGLKIGDTFTVSRTFTEADVRRFSEITKDYNPVHFDRRFVGAKKFRDPICHGLLVAALITEIGGQIGWLASGMNFRFKMPIYFKDTVTCTMIISEIDARGRAKARAEYRNQHGEIVLEAGLTGVLPGSAERAVMAAMVSEGDPTNPGGNDSGMRSGPDIGK